MVHHLFNDFAPGGNLPLGEAELAMNLDDAQWPREQSSFRRPSKVTVSPTSESCPSHWTTRVLNAA